MVDVMQYVMIARIGMYITAYALDEAPLKYGGIIIVVLCIVRMLF